jgi:hypothetical protein
MKRLDMHSRGELVRANYKEYQKASKKARGAILDRLVLETGLNRDYLATKLVKYKETAQVTIDGKTLRLRAIGKRKAREEGRKGGRPVIYTADFVKVLTAIWDDHQRQCGKLLKPAIAGMIEFLAAEARYGISAEIKALLLKVSAAEIDILLRPAKKTLEIRGISTTRAAGESLRAQVPVQTHFDRAVVQPGDFAFDTVANCGGSAAGQFCKTLTGTDVYSGWTEERALLNAANVWVQAAISDMREGLPFPLQSAHYDNGMEFINKPLLAWCEENHIAVSRSRPYHKNDNCYAEQKNYDAVRKTIGYFRFDTQEECDALSEVYRCLCPLYNYWYPSFKLIDKVQQDDGRYKKVYEGAPKTPYQRLLECPMLSDDYKEQLRVRKSWQNPVELSRLLDEAVNRLLTINRNKSKMEATHIPESDKALSLTA